MTRPLRPEVVEAARFVIRERRVRDGAVPLIVSSGEIIAAIEKQHSAIVACYGISEIRRLVTIAMLSLGAAPYARGQGRQCGRTFVVPVGVAI